MKIKDVISYITRGKTLSIQFDFGLQSLALEQLS